MATGLFGQNPNDALAAQQATEQATVAQQALWTPEQWATYAQAKGGQMAGRGVRGLLGIEDPALKELAVGKAMMEGVDLQDPDALEKLAKAYADKGLHRFGEEAFNRSRTLRKEKADVAEQVAKADKAKLSLTQEQKLRDEIAALGPNATEEQYLAVVRKYGKPDEVMKSIETRLQKEAALEEKKRVADERFRLEREKIASTAATEREKAQALALAKRQHDETLLAIAQLRTSGNAEKPLTEAQKIKLQRDVATSNKGLRDMDTTLQNTVDLAEEIKTHPGFEGAQGVSSLFPSMPGGKVAKAESLIEEFKASVKKAGLDLVRQGGSIGAMTQQEWPIVESMVATINPRAGNVKEQMDKVIAKINQIRNNAYQTHNESFSENKTPFEITAKKKAGAVGTKENPIVLK